MNDRQHYALTHPLNNADIANPHALLAYRHLRLRGDGVYVCVILAVDR